VYWKLVQRASDRRLGLIEPARNSEEPARNSEEPARNSEEPARKVEEQARAQSKITPLRVATVEPGIKDFKFGNTFMFSVH
jgi:hypothetical protein